MRDEVKVEKLLKLHDRVKELKAQKKSMGADYKDQIKDVEAEIDALVEELQTKE